MVNLPSFLALFSRGVCRVKVDHPFRANDVEATTIAGLVREAAGRIPHSGEAVEHDGLQFEVLESTDRRIERVRVSKLAPPPAPPAQISPLCDWGEA